MYSIYLNLAKGDSGVIFVNFDYPPVFWIGLLISLIGILVLFVGVYLRFVHKERSF